MEKKIAFPPGVGSPLVLRASYLNIVRSCFCAPKLKCMFNCCNCNLFSNGIITRRDEERLCIILLFSFSIFVLTFCLNLGWSLGRETVQLLWDKEMTLPLLACPAEASPRITARARVPTWHKQRGSDARMTSALEDLFFLTHCNWEDGDILLKKNQSGIRFYSDNIIF